MEGSSVDEFFANLQTANASIINKEFQDCLNISLQCIDVLRTKVSSNE